MKPMKLLVKIPLSLATGLLLLMSGCGGSDSASGETTPVVKLLSRNSTSGTQLVLTSIDNELTAARAAGVAPRSSGCFIRSSFQPMHSFWLIVEVPVEQLPVAQGLGFQPKESSMGPDPAAYFFEVKCSDL